MRTAAVLLVGLVLVTPLTASQDDSVTVQVRSVDLLLPAVAQLGDGSLVGVASRMTVRMQSPGSGQAYLQLNTVAELDMQAGARQAVAVAQNILQRPSPDADFFFTIDAESGILGGPSGGGAMTIAVLVLLAGGELESDAVMTGMINPDGTLGPVGGILQKLEAAAQRGAATFVIPLGQARQVIRTDAGLTTIDVVEYGRQEHGVEVVEAADVYEALPHMADFELVRPSPNEDPLRDEHYRRTTTNLSDRLVAQITSERGDARDRLGRLTVTANERAAIEGAIASAESRLESAEANRTANRHYVAASSAFQALVDLEYAAALLGYFEAGSGNARAWVADYIEEGRRLRDEAETRVDAEGPVTALEARGASALRFLEAARFLAEAEQLVAVGETAAALQAASFARQRTESAEWWFEIGQGIAALAGTRTWDPAVVRDLTEDFAASAREIHQYAVLIFGDAAVPERAGESFALATESLAQAEAALQAGRVEASLYEFIESVAQTNAALVSIAGDAPVRGRLDHLGESAAYNVEQARSNGLAPVYSLSLLELGQSRAQSDPVASYTAFSSAGIGSGLLLAASGVSLAPPARRAVDDGLGLGPYLWAELALIALVLVVGLAIVFRPRRDHRVPSSPSAPTEPSAPPPAPFDGPGATPAPPQVPSVASSEEVAGPPVDPPRAPPVADSPRAVELAVAEQRAPTPAVEDVEGARPAKTRRTTRAPRKPSSGTRRRPRKG